MSQISYADQQHIKDKLHSLPDATISTDPVALKAAWTPIDCDPAHYNRRLKEVAPGRIEFEPSNTNKVLGFISVLVALFTLFRLGVHPPPPGEMLISIGVSALFIWAGIRVYNQRGVSTVFDKSRGYFWLTIPVDCYGNDKIEKHVRFQDIHAIQLLLWQGRPSGNRINCYLELNLVKENGDRQNVVVNSYAGKNLLDSEKENFRTEVKTIARFLDKPVWDVIDICINELHESQVDKDYEYFFGQQH